MSKLDSTAVNISLPTLARHFDVPLSDVSWVMLSFLLLHTNTMLIFGKLADRIGLKRSFIIGYLLFVLSSLLCGLSSNLTILIASRCFQGAAAAMMLIAAFALIPSVLPDRTGTAYGVMASAAGLGGIVGAPMGGFITGLLSWKWIFLINIPVGVAAVIVGQKILPDDRLTGAKRPAKEERFDLPGAVLSFFGLIFFIYAMTRARSLGWSSPSIVYSMPLGIALLAAFFVREKYCSSPLIDFRLFAVPGFTLGVMSALLCFIVMSGVFLILPFYLELFKGLRAEQAGVVIMFYPVVYMIFSPLGGRLSDRVDPGIVCMASMLSAAAAASVFIFTMGSPGLFPVILFLVWFALSYCFFLSSNNNKIMNLAPADRKGVASGVLGTFVSLGTVFGVDLFTGIFSSAVPDPLASGKIVSGSPEILLTGFERAFGAAVIACLLAAVFSFLSIRRWSGKEAVQGIEVEKSIQRRST